MKMFKTIFYIFIGGGVGSALRFLIGHFTIKYYAGNFPLATLLANVLSCLIVALFVYLFAIKSTTTNQLVYPLVVIGFCGGLSTFSTFSFETFELIKQGAYFYAFLNVSLSLIVGLVAMFAFYNKSLN